MAKGSITANSSTRLRVTFQADVSNMPSLSSKEEYSRELSKLISSEQSIDSIVDSDSITILDASPLIISKY